MSVVEVTEVRAPRKLSGRELSAETECRRAIGSSLFLAEVDGEVWATNSYWAGPAQRLGVDLVLERAGLPSYPLPSGKFFVRGPGKVDWCDQEAPRLQTIVDGARDCSSSNPLVELSAYEVDGVGAVCIQNTAGVVRVFTAHDGRLVGLNADYVDFLSDGHTRFLQRGDKPAGPVLVERYSSAWHAKGGKSEFRTMQAVLMPVHLPAKAGR